MYRAEQRRQRHAQADLIQAIALGYGGSKSSKGDKSHKAMVQALKALRG